MSENQLVQERGESKMLLIVFFMMNMMLTRMLTRNTQKKLAHLQTSDRLFAVGCFV